MEVERATLLRGARLKTTYHLSLADAIIARTAQGLGATLAHRDPELAALSEEFALEPEAPITLYECPECDKGEMVPGSGA